MITVTTAYYRHNFYQYRHYRGVHIVFSHYRGITVVTVTVRLSTLQ